MVIESGGKVECASGEKKWREKVKKVNGGEKNRTKKSGDWRWSEKSIKKRLRKSSEKVEQKSGVRK